MTNQDIIYDERLFAMGEVCDGRCCADKEGCARWMGNHDFRKSPRYPNANRRRWPGRCPDYVPSEGALLRLKEAKEKKRAAVSKPRPKKIKPCIGPRYTKEDEEMLVRACLEAADYMRTFGRGRRLPRKEQEHTEHTEGHDTDTEQETA